MASDWTGCTLTLAAANPLDHVVQHQIWPIGGFTIFSNHTVMQMLAAALLVWLMPKIVRLRAGNDEVGRHVPRGIGTAIESICMYLKTQVAEPLLGAHAPRFLGYVWTTFFFVLTCNLLGNLPLAEITNWFVPNSIDRGHGIGGTSTGNIWVTATLAGTTFIMILYNGLHVNGVAYIQHFFQMAPFPVNILVGVLELMGLFFKAFALAVRLFANMIAGHILLATLLMLVMMAAAGMGTAGGFAIAIPVVAGSLFVRVLELFVAFLQAFIFTFLSVMFIGQALNIHHDHDEHHEDAREEPHGVGPVPGVAA
jgi:F-type H+-transporting ATPase subunit a